MKRFCIVLMVLIVGAGRVWSQAQGERNDFTRFLNDPRVDSIYLRLSPDERIAQLFWLMTENLNDAKSFQQMLLMVETWQPGGLLYMKNEASDIARFSNQASQKSKVPLMFSIDGETGLAMRVKGIAPMPKAMTLGAIGDDELIYRTGAAIAKQMHRLGIHVNFAPVADVNINPANPVIGVRSFGENPGEVARRAVAYMRGMQDEGIVAVAKHFPGHGDTDTDSHEALPHIKHTRERMDSVDLVPFDAMIKNGVMGVMSAHLEVSALDTTRGLPASLSKPILSDLLRRDLGFDGVIVTDAMNMKGVKKAGQPGRVDVMALMAGNDIVESTENIGAAISSVKTAIEVGELTWDDIEQKCKKALALKLWAQCEKTVSVKVDSIVADINAAMDADLLPLLYRNALTVLRQKKDTSAVYAPAAEALLLVMPGGSALADSIANHRQTQRVVMAKGMPQEVAIQQIKASREVIVCMGSFADTRKVWDEATLATLWRSALAHHNLSVVYGGSAYHLNQLKGVEKAREVVLMYEQAPEAMQSAALYLSGKMAAGGKLPVSVGVKWKRGAGYEGLRW